MFVCEGPACVVQGVGAVAINGSGLVYEYRIDMDESWRVHRATMVCQLGTDEFQRTLERRDDDEWVVDGVHAPQFSGCTDLDLSFTPATNTIAIRRLGLVPGQEQPIKSLWITEPELTPHVAEQSYRKDSEDTYTFRDGDFTSVIKVDGDGLVEHYPAMFEVAREPVMT